MPPASATVQKAPFLAHVARKCSRLMYGCLPRSQEEQQMPLASRAGSPATTLCQSLLKAVLTEWTTVEAAEAAPVGSPWRQPWATEVKAAVAAILSWSLGACIS